jgi:uncharacterized coiled-coil protein SlyX
MTKKDRRLEERIAARLVELERVVDAQDKKMKALELMVRKLKKQMASSKKHGK